ncbi:MAG: hypothetical protein M1118_09390 [Chloroflexi bacterium]|nr:hypothetical protein [Chloroflexota bacterium]
MPWTTFGQDALVTPLSIALRSDRIAHAYLFIGAAHTGKTTLARDLARALLCEEAEPPCGACEDCRLLAAGTHPDFISIEDRDHEHVELSAIWDKRASEQAHRSLDIERVRELRAEVARSPVRSRLRVALIDGGLVHEAASSALLKLLEEPATHTVFILRATGAEALPPPVVSRCQVLTLRALPEELLVPWLVDHYGATIDAARGAAWLAGGRAGLAIRLVERADRRQALQERSRQLLEIPQLSPLDRLQRAAEWSHSVATARAILDLATRVWRDLLTLSVPAGNDEDDPGAHTDVRTMCGRELTDSATRPGPMVIAHQLRALQVCSWALDANAQPRLALEWLFSRWARWAHTPSAVRSTVTPVAGGE